MSVLQPPFVSATATSHPSMDIAFNDAVQGFSVAHDFVFGSAVVPAAGQTAIRNAADLATYFSPYGDAAGTAVINGELERYQTFDKTANFAFDAAALRLQATLDSGGVVTSPQASQATSAGVAIGSAVAIANFGLANTSTISVGQIVLLTYAGAYYVSAMVANSTITLQPLLGAPTTTFSNFLILWTPYAYAPLTSYTNTATLTFSAVPAQVRVGQFVSFASGSNTTAPAQIAVLSKTATTVTLDTAVTLGAGSGIFFTPPIRSAQLFTKDYFMAGLGGHQMVAVEITCRLPHGANAYPSTIGPFNTLAAFQSIPADAPYGAWPAFWMYSGRELNGVALGAGEEIDVFEFIGNATQDMGKWTGYTHAGLTAFVEDIVNTDCVRPGGTYSGGVYSTNTDLSCQMFTFGALITPSEVTRYIGGTAVTHQNWKWTSPQRAQVIANLAVGALGAGQAGNLTVPYTEASLANIALTIQRIRILTFGKSAAMKRTLGYTAPPNPAFQNLFSTTSKTAGITLSADRLTGTTPATSGDTTSVPTMYQEALVSNASAAPKQYFAIQVNSTSTSSGALKTGFTGMGFEDSAAGVSVTSTAPDQTTSSFACYGQGSSGYNGNGGYNQDSTAIDGSLCELAADFVNQVFWYRVTSNGAAGNWNQDPSANPVTGTNGKSFAGMSGTAWRALVFMRSAGVTNVLLRNDTMPPSGFSRVGGS